MVKFALIGIGYIGQAHLSVLNQIKNVQLVAIVDSREEIGRRLLRKTMQIILRTSMSF